jgi:hypothetical protein
MLLPGALTAFAIGLCGATYFAKHGAPDIRLTAPNAMARWHRLRPVLKIHDNTGRILPWLDSITYVPEFVGSAKTLSVPTDSVGTRTYASCPKDGNCRWDSPFATPRALAALFPDQVFQVVVRADDTYVGYLQEMLGTPFLMTPRRLPEGHQADLRLGTDCASLAAYGRRRMGETIPYKGPTGLLDHLATVPEGQMRSGDILHYGAQVQIVFEDRGHIGHPDGEDLVIESWHPFPRIVRQDSSGWEGHGFRVMRFRGDSGSR